MKTTRLRDLVYSAHKRRVSDLHFIEGDAPCIRQFGKLFFLDHPPITREYFAENIFPLVQEDKLKEFFKNKELDFSSSFGDVCRARINLYLERSNLAASLRLIPLQIPGMKELGVPSIAHDFLKYHNGLVLVTGPTGCGKSTTLASMLEEINQTKPWHILTIEDPIEYLYTRKKALISQREVGVDTNKFTKALQHSFRQDPDVVLVGEMRNLETIETVITLAETGHLTFSTLHTNDSVETLNRIIDSFPPYQQNQIRLQLMVCLRGVISQRLLPHKSGKGLVPVWEIMVVNKAIRNLIKEGKNYHIHSSIQTGFSEGMTTLFQSVASAFEKGLISYETALVALPEKRPFIEKYGHSKSR